ncbi:hypothetical protein HID58_065401 [Brassica napus]|uniref:Uncharacterized protein n=1 Tax=Brassica napus TaxID=3708 RepID=A0ABQ7ZCP7_BRANA|nr:hypothetical protein HID58_065401 [Brassica napus]
MVKHRLWLPPLLGFPEEEEARGDALTTTIKTKRVNVVRKIRSVQGSDLTKETTRVVICLFIDP